MQAAIRYSEDDLQGAQVKLIGKLWTTNTLTSIKIIHFMKCLNDSLI